MSKQMRPRADAARNEAQLIAAARDAFLTGEDTVSLERIAEAAGVGIGTLYRHFPNRGHLAEAVYRAEFDELMSSAPDLPSEHSAFEALRIWLSRYSLLIFSKRAMHYALRDTLMSCEAVASMTWKRMNETQAIFIAAGVVAAAAFSADRERISRLLTIVATGVRP